jgi:hypothetical protein
VRSTSVIASPVLIHPFSARIGSVCAEVLVPRPLTCNLKLGAKELEAMLGSTAGRLRHIGCTVAVLLALGISTPGVAGQEEGKDRYGQDRDRDHGGDRYGQDRDRDRDKDRDRWIARLPGPEPTHPER